MQLLNFTGWRELPPAPRRFLFFSAINVISWQCIVGQVLVIFARELEMPPAWVGVLLAFLPLSMLLVVGTVPLVEWQGPRRVLSWGWLLRNLLATSVFAIPWAQSRWGPAGAWQVLLFATLAFSTIRALGVGGWYPWLHEVVPPHQQGTYFATETALAQLVTIMVALGSGLILGSSPGLTGFFLLYGLGIAAGFLSVVAIQRIPGGRRSPPRVSRTPREGAYAPALADRQFVAFVTRTMLGLTALATQNGVTIMYLRDILGYSARQIMFLLGVGSLVIALVITFWGRRADRLGSNRVLFEVLLAHSLIVLLWLVLLPGHAWTTILALGLVTGAALFNSAFLTVAVRGMLGRVRERGRVGYTNLWIIASSLALGLPPILAGLAIDWWGLAGFRLSFLFSGALGLLAAYLLLRLVPEGDRLPLDDLDALLPPVQPFRVLARLSWLVPRLPGGKSRRSDRHLGQKRSTQPHEH